MFFNTALYINQQVPIKQRPYRLTPVKQAIVKEQIKDMLNARTLTFRTGFTGCFSSQKRWKSQILCGLSKGQCPHRK